MPIIPANLNDVPELVALINSAYRGESSKKGWTTEADLIDGTRTNEQGLTDDFNTPGVTILKHMDDEGKIIGCVYLQKQGDKLYLGMLTVSPDLQANGLGRQLLQAAEDFALQNHLKAITMSVISNRTELIAWYERRGFSKTGEVIPFNIPEHNGIVKQPLEMLKFEKAI